MTVIRNKEYPIIYPSSDGKPMADNTVQFNWLVKIKQGLEQTTQNQNTFVAGDLLWYPVQGNNKIRLAPDVMVAVGRPKGDRGSYLQWKEGNIPPQIVIEILSPGNRPKEMKRKLHFYEKYGVQEYIIFDPKRYKLTIHERKGEKLEEVSLKDQKWSSAFVDFYLTWDGETLIFYQNNGERFKSHEELIAEKNAAILNATKAEHKAEQAEHKATAAQHKTEKAEREAALLAKKLKELGIDPDDVLGK